MGRMAVWVTILFLGLGSLGAQAWGDELSLLGKPFGAILAEKGSPQALGHEAGFLDSPSLGRFFASWFDYYLSCDDKYTFSSPILLGLVAEVSARPLRRGYAVLAYPAASFWIEEGGQAVALEYTSSQALPPALGRLASLEDAQARLGSPRGRIEGWYRFSPPKDLPGLGEVLIYFDGPGPRRVVLFSPAYALPEAWDWGDRPKTGKQG